MPGSGDTYISGRTPVRVIIPLSSGNLLTPVKPRLDPGSRKFALVRERLIVSVGAGSGKLVVREARSGKLAIPVRDRSGKWTAPAGARAGR